MNNYLSFKRQALTGIEQTLDGLLSAQPGGIVRDAAQYVVLDGGHRWRALVAVAAGHIFSNNAIIEASPAACAIELTHAASLILDDLPSMDNAQLRRRKACVHLVFPQWAVDLLPAYLVNLAFATILDRTHPEAEGRTRAAVELAHAASAMCRGQELDVTQQTNPESPASGVEQCCRDKSAALFGAAAATGALMAGANPAEAATLRECGMDLGMAYQFNDDISDVVAPESHSGKTGGQDHAKRTAASVFGLEEARLRAERYMESALARIESFGSKAAWLRHLIHEAGRPATETV